MTNDPIQGAGAHGLNGPTGPTGPNGPTGPTSERSASSPEAARSGAAFEALLEKLETRAQDLKQTAEEVAGPTDLSGAMDQARESLDDALSLGDRLLEAYRQATQNRKE